MVELNDKSYLGGDNGIPFKDRAKDLISDTYVGSKSDGFTLAETYLLLGIHAAMLLEATRLIENYEQRLADSERRTRTGDNNLRGTPAQVSGETCEIRASVAERVD